VQEMPWQSDEAEEQNTWSKEVVPVQFNNNGVTIILYLAL